ncbi:MAG: TatD family hydrolase [Clostridia bacterium]|nr:TatD family hydrolase [Clostridia bacterium]
MYIDIHCHLTGGEYEEIGGVESVIVRARENGVGRIVCSGFDLDSSKIAAELAKQYDEVYFTAGFHPSELGKYKDGDLKKLRALFSEEKCIGVGEIGLDYHFEDNPPAKTQREMFIRQLVLADEAGLPVVIHSRDAAQETLLLLQEQKNLLKKGGLLHCYSYSAEMLADFCALGLSFSFGGPSTFKNAKKVQECVQRIPAPCLLSETDCPYLTPVPFRGVFPNEPKNVKYVVQNMAALRNENEEELKKQILANAKRLFFKLK